MDLQTSSSMVTNGIRTTRPHADDVSTSNSIGLFHTLADDRDFEDELNSLNGHTRPEVADVVDAKDSISSNSVQLLPPSSGFFSNGSITFRPGVGILATSSSLIHLPLANITNSTVIDWRLMNDCKNGAENLAWITEDSFFRVVKLDKKDVMVLDVFARLSDHQKIPESLIKELQTCQKLSVVKKALRTVKDIFYSYGQYVGVLEGELRHVRNIYYGLQKNIRRLAGNSSRALANTETQDSVHPDRIHIAETLATLNLLAVRASKVFQEIINMHGRCPGI